MKTPIRVGMGAHRAMQFKFLLEVNRDDLLVGGNAKAGSCVGHLKKRKRRILLRKVGTILLFSLQ